MGISTSGLSPCAHITLFAGSNPAIPTMTREQILRLHNKGEDGCQWHHRNSYCPDCKAFGLIPHKEGCKGVKLIISASARMPRKNASKKVWDDFYDKFVLRKDLIEYLNKPKKMTKWRKERRTREIENKIQNEKRRKKQKELAKRVKIV